jgi:hypothetical protein
MTGGGGGSRTRVSVGVGGASWTRVLNGRDTSSGSCCDDGARVHFVIPSNDNTDCVKTDSVAEIHAVPTVGAVGNCGDLPLKVGSGRVSGTADRSTAPLPVRGIYRPGSASAIILSAPATSQAGLLPSLSTRTLQNVVRMYLSAHPSACLSACLPACLPAFLPACLPACLSACCPAVLLPLCLPALMPAFLTACLAGGLDS